MSECTGGKGFPVVAFLWDMPYPDLVHRVMFRRCGECQRLDVCELAWINPQNLWCQACLSQEVVPLVYGQGHRQWQCLECKSISGLIEQSV